MRVGRKIVGRVAAVAGTMALLAGATPAGSWFVGNAGAASPTITVTPNTGLADTQSVTVAGTGFSPNATILTIECVGGAAIPDGCALVPLGSGTATSDGSGKFSVNEPVRRLIVTSPGSTVDCALKTCQVTALNVANFSENASASISFNPNIPPVLPTLTVTPNGKLVDHQLVTVTGKGFTQNALLQLSECTDPNTCADSNTRLLLTNNGGSFTAKNFPVQRILSTFSDSGDPVNIDCAAAKGRCSITIVSDGVNPPVQSPLQFDASKPPLVPSITVSPSKGLNDLQRITVRGKNFLPGAPVTIGECAGPSDFGACDFQNSQDVTPGLHGEFTLAVAAHRLLPPFLPTTPNAKNTDCARMANLCSIAALSNDGSSIGNVGLTFNKSAKPAVPSISASPTKNLSDDQNVRVTLRGFAPARPISIVECDAAAFKQFGTAACDGTTEQVTSAPAGVAPVTTIAVHRAVSGLLGLTDCTTKSGACLLVAEPFNGLFGAIGGGFFGGPGVSGPIGAGPAAPLSANNAAKAATFVARWRSKTGIASLAQPSVAAASGASGVPNLATVSLSFAGR